MRSLTAALVVLLALLAGCSSEEGEGRGDEKTPATEQSPGSASPEPASPEYAESAACREAATPVVVALEMAAEDEDVRDVAGRLVAIEEMGPSATSQCSPELVSVIRKATTGLECRLDTAMVASGMADAPLRKCEGLTMDEVIQDEVFGRAAARNLLEAKE